MGSRRRPTAEDRVEATRRFLSGVAAGDDVFEMSDAVVELHPRDNTFPGEVFVGLAAEALAEAGVTRKSPIDEEGLVDRFLPECELKAAPITRSATPSPCLLLSMAA